jgi:DNA-binding phage protein
MKNTTLPSKRALAVLDEPPLTDGTAQAKRVSKKVTAAIDKMVSGECRTIADAAEQVGLARESLSRALSRPHVAELMRTKVLRSLAIAATRAGATKVELLDSANEMVRDRASSFVLGLAGIKPSKLNRIGFGRSSGGPR